MIGFNNEIWVTSALTDAEVKTALILCYSLRRCFTNRKVAVIANQQISIGLREALIDGFDLVLYMDDDFNTAGLEPNDFVKLFAILCMSSFDKCAYLSPFMLALQNCDDIFQQLSTCELALSGNDEDLSVLLYTSGKNLFKTVMTWLRGKTFKVDGALRDLITKWLENQVNGGESKLHEKYNIILQHNRKLKELKTDVGMVNLINCYPSEVSDLESRMELQFGLLGKSIAIRWRTILENDVSPILERKLSVLDSFLPVNYTPVKEPIAIVGMSCRFPGSNNLQEFWELLFHGNDGICNPPPFRWRREQCCRPRPESGKTNAGFLKVPVDEFDAKFFGLSPKEVVCMDPQHRLLHELIWEGLEDACIDPHTLRSTSGSVFMGSWTNDYKDILVQSGTDQFYRGYMGNSIGAAAARLSFLLGLTGPSIATESGCSSAMVAVHMACRSLHRGETNLALACGVNLLLHPFDKEVMPMVIASDGHCKTFSDDADGFARAEGCATLVLKRLSDAVKDGDRIWGLIKGSAISQEGVSKSMGTPTVHCEALAMKEALKDAQVRPDQVSYVETHGTGTVVGDPMEVAAITEAYGGCFRKEPLIIGSVKTNVGHTESCSGITGIIKTVLAMYHETIPEHRNFHKLNPSIDLTTLPAIIPLEQIPWKKSQSPRFAGVSSFGITGTDAHVIIQEPPTISTMSTLHVDMEEKSWEILKLSAKSKEALELLVDRYKEHLKTCEDSLVDICYSANTGRANFPFRTTLLAKSKSELVSMLEQQKCTTACVGEETSSKICFLFTGQGSQYISMGAELYKSSPVFRMNFDYCSDILLKKYHIDIKSVIWSSSSEQIKRTIFSQTGIFCIEYALLELWKSWGITPDYVIGHSLGEFAAAVAAGILTVEEAIQLVAERSRLIDQLPEGSMLVVKADQKRVENLLRKDGAEDRLDIAAVNSQEQTVLAGDSSKIMEFSKICKENLVDYVILEASHAFHSRHMDEMLEEYGNRAAGISMSGKTFNCGYISGVKGDLIEKMIQIDSQYWVDHTRERVNFKTASKNAQVLGCDIFLEIGPHPVLSALTMINNEKLSVTCLPSLNRRENEWKCILTSVGKLYLKGIPINWSGLEMFRNRNKVSLPHYPFIGKKYWPDLMQVGSSQMIHPLLGAPIENASASKLFQTGLNLRTSGYIKDHCIGHHVVFPGAGYLEMSLAAGISTIHGSIGKASRPLKIQNLCIEAPLELIESKTVQVQTLLEHNADSDWNEMNIKILRRVDEDTTGATTTPWFLHAKSKFHPLLSEEEKTIHFSPSLLQETIVRQDTETEIVSEVYEKLAAIGLNFGPAFRSIEKLWKVEESRGLLVKVKLPGIESDDMSNPQSNYVVHPVILDAMIQAIMMTKLTDSLKRKVYVPIQIGNFIWFPVKPCENADIFVYVVDTSSKSSRDTTECVAYLLNSEGTVMAVMSKVEFIDTTAQAVESVLKQQTTKMPDMWEEIWRTTTGPGQYSIDLDILAETQPKSEEFFEHFDAKYNRNEELMQTFQQLDHFTYLSMLKSLYDCDWTWGNAGESFGESDMLERVGIQAQFRKQVNFFLDVFVEEGILQKMDSNSWTIINHPPTLKEINIKLNSSEFVQDLVEKFHPTLLFAKVSENLSRILTGGQSALSILFPADDSVAKESSAGEFYSDFIKLIQFDKMIVEMFTQWQQAYKTKSSQKFILRVLEIGAGTGGFTKGLLESFADNEIDFEYTYTDISAVFFPQAEKKFEKYVNNMKFKKLNIEEDPLAQGFVPEYYDMIIAGDVIHATRNLKETLFNARILLKPGGFFELYESIKRNRFISFLFGLLDGFWRFDDFDVRPDHCTVDKETWLAIMEEVGLHPVGVYPCANGFYGNIKSIRTNTESKFQRVLSELRRTWIVFYHENDLTDFIVQKLTQMKELNRRLVVIKRGSQYVQNGKCIYINPTEQDDFVQLFEDLTKDDVIEGIVYGWPLDNSLKSQDDILQPYFNLVKVVSSLKQHPPRISVLTCGTVPFEDSDLKNFKASTLLGFTRCLKNELSELPVRCIEVARADDGESEKMQVFYELWSNEKDTQVVYTGSSRVIPKFLPHKPTMTDLELPRGTDRFQLILPDSKAIQDLVFGPLENLALGENEIEVKVVASALNFRDVFSVLKPTEEFNNVNSIGFDQSGIVNRIGSKVTKWKVGDYVFGVNVNGGALPSHVKLHEDDVLPVPENMTLSEACTLPAVVVTSYHCLVDVAKVTKSDTVLIHTASGGVGLSAIQICQGIGAKIIATAGSKRKQNYLRALGIKHVFHSRNTKYCDEILKVTGGRGVDVVLNSLTSEGFKEATLNACARGARFVEMSKLSIWHPDEVSKLRSDVVYTIVDVSSMESSAWRRLIQELQELVKKNTIQPIPYVRFNGVNIREALQYMQKAKHIGKVVCVMPEVRRNESGQAEIYTPLFNDKSTYLITGGLTGIGFEVCKWMLKSGAKHVVLMGRRGASEAVQKTIDLMNSTGNNIKCFQGNVGSYHECKDLIENFIPTLGMPPLRGVMHSAGTLHDGLISTQTWENLSSTFTAKVDGSLNLHRLTKDLRLEHFVMFSSMAALLGSPGQCNHSAGNYFEDTLAHARVSIGLPATTINYSPWAQVGIATELEFPGVKPLSNLQGLTALEYALKSQRVQTCVLNVESIVLMSKLLPQAAVFIDERVWKSGLGVGASNSKGKINSEEFWQQYDSLEGLPEKMIMVREKIGGILREILKLDETDKIDESSNFQDMGCDSLMFVELKNELQALVGDRVTVNASAVRDCSTVGLLTEKLVTIIEGEEINDQVLPSMDQVNQLIREDCKLPEDITPGPYQVRVSVDKISTVLLTGCTGMLGPYVLKELSNMKQIKQIICLVKSIRKHKNGLERLKSVLQERQILDQVEMSKVKCVVGNIALDKMGLEEVHWKQLADSVDAVFHCAASVQHIEHYKITDASDTTSMRAVNVSGLKNVLNFCCSGKKLKCIYGTSSVVGVATLDQVDEVFSESWPQIEDYDNITTFSYPVTKFVQDMLMKQAVERGIPGKQFRFALITGDSTSGRFVMDNNHMMLRYMFILKHGIMPSNPVPMTMLPVDVVAKTSLKIFFNEDAPNDIYNVINDNPDLDQEFIKIADKLGYKVDIIEFSEFTKKLKESSADDSPFTIFKDFYGSDEEMLELYNTTPVLRQWIIDGGQNKRFFRSKKLEKFLPEFYDGIGGEATMQFLLRDLQFAKNAGWLRKFGL